MNRKMIAYILGRVFLAEFFLMIPAVIVGLVYKESEALSFALPMAILVVAGLIFGMKKPQNTVIYVRDGFFIVAAAWIFMALAGAIPFYLCGHFESVWDCIFEMVSGFTTTGATVLGDPGALPKCILFWRSFSHWVGGMGVLVFVLAIMPMSDSLHIMRAEVPGPVVGKLVPKMRQTAIILYALYAVMTAILAIFLLCGGMPVFDAVCSAFGTAGTGGFSVRTEGIAYYNSAYIEMVLAVFMILFGINFNLFYLILIKRFKEFFKSEELKVYLVLVVTVTLLIAGNIYSIYGSVSESLRHAFFHTAAIITTTGYGTVDYALLWPSFAQILIVLITITGGCAGSTAGGLKLSRVMLLFKTFAQEMKHLLHPRAVTTVRLEGAPVENTIVRSTLVYFVMYVFIMIVSTVIISIDGFDFTTNLTAEITCFNNVGPGLGMVGPMGNFSAYSPLSKMVLSFNMLLGRLEIFPIIVFFSPSSWKKNVR
ncbi:MAG: TrkH family potassium uptake protein [Ruminococcaceae bacterium]|nr:TrkH family potassium uptake protein [Oscillospiraceae bacterium]